MFCVFQADGNGSAGALTNANLMDMSGAGGQCCIKPRSNGEIWLRVNSSNQAIASGAYSLNEKVILCAEYNNDGSGKLWKYSSGAWNQIASLSAAGGTLIFSQNMYINVGGGEPLWGKLTCDIGYSRSLTSSERDNIGGWLAANCI